MYKDRKKSACWNVIDENNEIKNMRKKWDTNKIQNINVNVHVIPEIKVIQAFYYNRTKTKWKTCFKSSREKEEEEGNCEKWQNWTFFLYLDKLSKCPRYFICFFLFVMFQLFTPLNPSGKKCVKQTTKLKTAHANDCYILLCFSYTLSKYIRQWKIVSSFFCCSL